MLGKMIGHIQTTETRTNLNTPSCSRVLSEVDALSREFLEQMVLDSNSWKPTMLLVYFLLLYSSRSQGSRWRLIGQSVQVAADFYSPLPAPLRLLLSFYHML